MDNDTTIGLDLGNKKHKVVGLDGCGKARFTVTPPVDVGNSFFMRVKVK